MRGRDVVFYQERDHVSTGVVHQGIEEVEPLERIHLSEVAGMEELASTMAEPHILSRRIVVVPVMGVYHELSLIHI